MDLISKEGDKNPVAFHDFKMICIWHGFEGGFDVAKCQNRVFGRTIANFELQREAVAYALESFPDKEIWKESKERFVRIQKAKA